MKRIINFSGGKTSGYMTIVEYKPGDIVLFCDTGREHPKTYKFIHDFEANENIPVVWVKFPGGFEGMLKKMMGIPNNFKRNCTRELKVRTARRYLVGLGITEYENIIGFRADEPQRVNKHKEWWKKVVTKFPLYEKGINKNDVNAFWKAKSYTLEIPSILGNCDLCFMKGKSALMAIMASYPELADKWIADEDLSRERNEGSKGVGHTYFKGTTMRAMREAATNHLFKDYKLEDINPAYSCACTT